MKAFKSTKRKVKEHIRHARKVTVRRNVGIGAQTYIETPPYDPPVFKKVDEDVWSVEWGGATVEFAYNLLGKEFVSVYPEPSGCRVSTDVLMTYGKSVVNFNGEYFNEEEVNPMAEECRSKLSKKDGKKAKKKDYYAGKEVKV